MTNVERPIISLFTGAMGLDLGLEGEGFQTVVAVEHNRHAAQTIRLNRPGPEVSGPKRQGPYVPVIERDIHRVPTSEILQKAGLVPGEAWLVSGGPSCQTFSTAGLRRSVADPQGQLYKEFIRVVREAQPRFFVMENVRGMLSAAKRHRPLAKRGDLHDVLEPDEELGSGFLAILEAFEELGYYTVFDVVNVADYGVPQSRERLLFIGSRDGYPVRIPARTHSRDGSGGLKPWLTLKDGLEGLEDESPVYAELLESKKKFLARIPEGGNWRNLPTKELQEEALNGAFRSWGGRSGFYRRLAWAKTPPSLTTAPDSKATMLCHPDELRPLSIAEYAKLQQFPDGWEFAGSIAKQYQQIGNAVPTGLGRVVRDAIIEAASKPADSGLKATIRCPNRLLLERWANRPVTFLNPPRMREGSDPEATRRWLNHRARRRGDVLLKYLDVPEQPLLPLSAEEDVLEPA